VRQRLIRQVYSVFHSVYGYFDMEPYLLFGLLGDSNADAHAYLESTELVDFMDAKDNWLVEIEVEASGRGVEDADADAVELVGVDAHEPGDSRTGASRERAPALAEGTAGIEPAGTAEEATTAKPEAQEPRAEGKAGRGRRESARLRAEARRRRKAPSQEGQFEALPVRDAARVRARRLEGCSLQVVRINYNHVQRRENQNVSKNCRCPLSGTRTNPSWDSGLPPSGLLCFLLRTLWPIYGSDCHGDEML